MFHRGQLPGHTPAILEEIPAMACDGLRGDASRCLKIAAKLSFSSHRVAGPYGVKALVSSRRTKP